MPIRKTVRVDKQNLDPFGQREQALRHAKQRADVPLRPNNGRIEYHAKDRGDHYEIQIVESREAGPGPIPGSKRSKRAMSRMSDNAGMPSDFEFGLGFNEVESEGDFLSIEGPSRLASDLNRLLSETDLRRLEQRHGLNLTTYGTKKQKILELIDKRPDVARRAAGYH